MAYVHFKPFFCVYATFINAVPGLVTVVVVLTFSAEVRDASYVMIMNDQMMEPKAIIHNQTLVKKGNHYNQCIFGNFLFILAWRALEIIRVI